MSGALRYALAEPREAVYVLPRWFACRVFGVHTAVCAGRRDEVHMVWARDLRHGLVKRPWWDRVHPVWAVRDVWVRARDAVALPALVDRALSRLMLRSDLRYGDLPAQRIDIRGYGCCAVCEARWRAGRRIKHSACSDRVASAVEWFVRLRQERAADGGGA